eukprot:sb/3468427/
MTHYGVYPKDDSVDLVMGGVIERYGLPWIDHLIDRLGKGQFDKKPFGKKEQNDKMPGIMLPCEACTVRAGKRYSHVECQTDPITITDDLETSIDQDTNCTTSDEVPKQKRSLSTSSSVTGNSVINSCNSPPKTGSVQNAITLSGGAIPQFDCQCAAQLRWGIFTDTDVNDNDSNLSSDDEFFLEEDLYTEAPLEVQEYEIARETRAEVPEIGTTETIHFKMFPHKNMYVSGHRKFIGTLPKRMANRHNYQLNYHITVSVL